MLVVIDIGNTRTKWAAVEADGCLAPMQMAMNADIATSSLKESLRNADQVIAANVAGDDIAQQLASMVPQHTKLTFATAAAGAESVTSRYDLGSLGIDRWAAAVAAWQRCLQPVIVINAGTAITIDALTRDKVTKNGAYLGGSIMPGLRLMYQSLAGGTANLPSESEGEFSMFPNNTQDAIHSGCINAVVGAVVLQLKQLEKYCAFLPKVVISGGDAVKIAEALSMQLQRVAVIDDLVLQGLVLLEKEYV